MISQEHKERLRFFCFITTVSLFIGVFFTASDFITTPFVGLKDGFELFKQWFIIYLVLWLLVYLLSVNKYIFGILCLGIPIAAILAYFRYTMHATFTPMILDAALDNDFRITAELISFGLIAFVVFSLSVAVAFTVYRIKKIKVRHGFIHLIVSLSLLAVILNVPRIGRPLSERIPFNMYYVTARYLSEKEEIKKERPSFPCNAVCHKKSDSLIVVFIIGESLRSDHLGLNGYDRNTTPRLAKEDVISFPNIYSEYTHTNASLPHILTRADSTFPERAYNERSFVDLFKRCGFYTAWLANQEPADSYVYFMHECDTLMHVNINKSSYVYDRWVDGDMLPLLDNCLEKNNPRKLILLHTIGSHWYYNAHYTDEFHLFDPICESKIVSSCTREAMINSYDNTVVYTDYFLCEVIERLRNRNAIVFYLSDHGESLGEEGIWLHAADSPPLHNPACFVWTSPAYKTAHAVQYQTAMENRHKRYRTDFLFHTITQAAGITG
ncbi:MAG: phosphoethanolamine transferase, partial [Bacteroidales bacterium]|nr:phosphoethanolamine transferase [Bacteroidales bacterium]